MGMFETVLDAEKIYSLDEIKERLEPVFRSSQVKKAVLYGSYAQNCANEKSDVDIIVDSGLRGLKFYGLLGAAQLALGKEVHMYDVYYLRNISIGEEFIRAGVVIYEG